MTVLVWPPASAVPTASVPVCPTTEDRRVTSVHLVTMDTQTVPVSAGSLRWWGLLVACEGVPWERQKLGFAAVVASSHDSGANVHFLPHLSHAKRLLAR